MNIHDGYDVYGKRENKLRRLSRDWAKFIYAGACMHTCTCMRTSHVHICVHCTTRYVLLDSMRMQVISYLKGEIVSGIGRPPLRFRVEPPPGDIVLRTPAPVRRRAGLGVRASDGGSIEYPRRDMSSRSPCSRCCSIVRRSSESAPAAVPMSQSSTGSN